MRVDATRFEPKLPSYESLPLVLKVAPNDYIDSSTSRRPVFGTESIGHAEKAETIKAVLTPLESIQERVGRPRLVQGDQIKYLKARVMIQKVRPVLGGRIPNAT